MRLPDWLRAEVRWLPISIMLMLAFILAGHVGWTSTSPVALPRCADDDVWSWLFARCHCPTPTITTPHCGSVHPHTHPLPWTLDVELADMLRASVRSIEAQHDYYRDETAWATFGDDFVAALLSPAADLFFATHQDEPPPDDSTAALLYQSETPEAYHRRHDVLRAMTATRRDQRILATRVLPAWKVLRHDMKERDRSLLATVWQSTLATFAPRFATMRATDTLRQTSIRLASFESHITAAVQANAAFVKMASYELDELEAYRTELQSHIADLAIEYVHSYESHQHVQQHRADIQRYRTRFLVSLLHSAYRHGLLAVAKHQREGLTGLQDLLQDLRQLCATSLEHTRTPPIQYDTIQPLHAKFHDLQDAFSWLLRPTGAEPNSLWKMAVIEWLSTFWKNKPEWVDTAAADPDSIKPLALLWKQAADPVLWSWPWQCEGSQTALKEFDIEQNRIANCPVWREWIGV